MAYILLQVGRSMSFRSECLLTGQCRVDLLSLPAYQAGELIFRRFVVVSNKRPYPAEYTAHKLVGSPVFS
jgi:hypothetical protein